VVPPLLPLPSSSYSFHPNSMYFRTLPPHLLLL
jgi:hypothetical protein